VDYETGHFAHDEGYSGASAIMIAQRLDPDHAFSHEVIAPRNSTCAIKRLQETE
jgi:hypothetical protein